MYYLGELAKKPCARQEILGSNLVVCKKILTSCTFCPGYKTGTKASLEPGQKAESVVVVLKCRGLENDAHEHKFFPSCRYGVVLLQERIILTNAKISIRVH